MLRKSTFREIRSSLARYLAIFSIVALGVGFFSGLKDCKASMVRTTSDYLDETNFYDYEILSSYGLDDESVKTASEWDGVEEAEGSVQIDMLAGSGDVEARAVKVISMPDSINRLRLVSGRLPEADDECVIDATSITENAYNVGDSVVFSDENDKDRLKDFRITAFKIVGTVNTPIYLDYQRGSTDIGNGSLSSFMFIKKEAFSVDYMTNLYLKLSGGAEAFSEAQDELLEGSEDGMEALAETVTRDRREKEQNEAQEKLDEKKREYEDGLAEYEKEKADAEKKIKDARSEIAKGRAEIKKNRKKVNAAVKKAGSAIDSIEETIADLEAKKQQVEAGIAEADAKKEELEAGYAAGVVTEEQYAAAFAEISGTVDALNANLQELDAGLAEAEKGLKKAKTGLKKAKAGLSELDRQEKKLDSYEAELEQQEKKADREFRKAKKELEDAKDKIDEAQEKISDMETGSSYALSREDNAGYASFDSNSGIVNNIAKVFPVFFFLIAALVCMTTMTRMIDEQRTQVGVLKALGYSNAQVAGKYLFYSGSAAFAGAVAGFFAGCKVFPLVIWRAYTMMYGFSDTVAYVIDPKLGIISVAAALLCSMGATWVSIAADFRVEPSALIRPKTPPAGKRILLERITPVWDRISFLYKVSIRNIFRDKKRFFMMVIGVGGCTALLIAGMGIKTTISKVADHQFDEISLYDFIVVFNKDMRGERRSEFEEALRENNGIEPAQIKYLHQAEVKADVGGADVEVSCVAADPEGFEKFVDLHSDGRQVAYPGDGEAVIPRKFNHDNSIETGDVITLREGYREMTVTVSGIAENYVSDNIYMNIDTYEKGFGKKADLKAAYVSLEDGADEAEIREAGTTAANYENTAAVQLSLDVRDNVAKMMKSLDSVVFVVILSAALLAFIVLYNLTNITITERVREIATIKVLGFRQNEVSQYVFRENIFMTAVAALAGIPMGVWLLRFVVDNIVIKMVYFEARLTRMDILAAVILTFVFSLGVDLVMQRRLRDVSMTESLKSVE